MSQRQLTKRVWSKGRQNENGVWVESGWVTTPIKQEEEGYFKAKPTIMAAEDKFFNLKNDMDCFKAIQDEIQYGTDKDRIDELPHSQRQLLYSSDAWYISKANKLFRIVDPETQAKDGEWGSDTDDSDTENRLERSSTVRLFLEHSGIIEPEENAERVTDILGSINFSENDNKEVMSAGFGLRVDTEIDRVSISPEDAAINLIDGEEMEVDGVEATDDDTATLQDPRLINNALPSVPENVMNKVRQQKVEFDALLAKTDDDAERDQLFCLFEDAVDRLIGPYLTNSLNSPFCARGYSPPRRKHTKIQDVTVSEVAEAAGIRLAFFHTLFREASDCTTYEQLFGGIGGGFYAYIREMNVHDKELSNKWSIRDKKNKEGDLVELSAFNQQRMEYIRRWREEERGDEEHLRVNLWAIFDREQGEKREIEIDELGRETHIVKKWRDSIWRQRRTRALQDLHLTVGQWSAIYNMLKINKYRIELDKGHSEERNELLGKMREHFRRINNLNDLQTYIQWVEKRDWIMSSAKSDIRTTKKFGAFDVMKAVRYNTYKFKPSILDRLSIIDEHLWRNSCKNKRDFLIQRTVLYRKMMEASTEVIDAGIGETTRACYMPKCNSQTVDRIMFAKTDGDLGFLFVKCEECNKFLWFLGYDEEPIAKTLEEATEAWKKYSEENEEFVIEGEE